MNKIKKFPLNPKHPERICWGCDKYCSVNELGCGNGAERTQHPAELFGEDWFEMEPKGFNDDKAVETTKPTE